MQFVRTWPSFHSPPIIAQVALLLPWLQAQRDFWCSCESHTVSHRQEWHCGVPFLFNRGSYLGDAGAIWLCDTKIGFLLWQHCSRCQRQLQDKMPGAFQAGAKERLVCGFVVPSCNHFCSPPQKQDVTEEKGLEKKRVIESEGSGLKEAGGLGGTQPPGREWFGSKYL